jgi:multidrug resistance efflux pump
MEKNTIIAVILSVIVITVGMTIQTMFYPAQPATATESVEETSPTTDDAALSASQTVVVPAISPMVRCQGIIPSGGRQECRRNAVHLLQ